MKKFLTISALALALQPLVTLAAPVTLQSTWSCASQSTCAFAGTGLLTFTYDDTTVGVADGNAQFPAASYNNAITSATMTFDNIALTLDSTSTNKIQVRQGRNAGNGYDASLSFDMLGPDARKYHFGTYIDDSSQTNGGVELSWLAGLKSDEILAGELRPDDVSPGFPAALPYQLTQQTPLAPVPVPAAAWLFGSSMLGLAGLAQRKRA